MITTTIDGNAISQGFIDEIKSDSPNVTARLWYNGAEISCDIVEISVEKGSCGSNPFMIGEVVGDLLTATVKDLLTDIKGKVIECHIGALVSGDYEYISLGKFTVAEVKKTRYQSEITAYSGIVANTTGDFNAQNLVLPTIADLAIRLQSDLNCTITFDVGINTSLPITAQLNGLTDYQALQVLAICCGGYIINTNDGNIIVKQYNATPTLNVDTGMMVNLPEIAEMPYDIRNVGVLVSEATEDNEGNQIGEVYYTLASQEYIKVIKQGTEYYLEDENGNRIIANARPELADLYFECAYITEAIFNANIKPIVGYEYYPATIDLTLGDPRLEGLDVLNVEEISGDFYVVPCHKIIHKYTGGFTTEVKSADASDESNDIGTIAPITQRLQFMDRQTGKAQATAENAYQIADDTQQYFWFIEEAGSIPQGVGTGAHITEIPQNEFLARVAIDPTDGGGNLLARSNGIAVRDGLTELATFGVNGATVGKTSGGHTVIESSGMKVYADNGALELASIGYGSGASIGGGTSDAPYFVFGTRDANRSKGNYSFSSGENATAQAYCSTAFGCGTVAEVGYQTTLGKWNALGSDSDLLVIGIGTSANDRHNGLVAGSQGNLWIAGTLTQQSDKRLKEHKAYLDEEACEFVRCLKPACYIKDGENHVGFYAQDVKMADKWDCMTDEKDGYLTLGYIELIAPLVAYCQKLEKRIEELERKRGSK